MQTRQLKSAALTASRRSCYHHAICQNLPPCSRHRSAICLAATSDVQPQSHTSQTLPDVSLDDLLSGVPSPMPADMVASQPSKLKQRKKATRVVDGANITTLGDNTAAPPGARKRVAQLLQKAKQRRTVETTTATPQQETPSSSSSSSSTATANVEQTNRSSQLSKQELSIPQTHVVGQPSMAEGQNVDLHPVSQPANQSGLTQTIPVVSDDVDYGPLQTRRKRRSRLFNLNSDVSLPSIAAAVLQPEVMTPVAQPNRLSQAQPTQQPLTMQTTSRMKSPPSSIQPSSQSQDTFVSSTKQARRARLRGHQRNRNPSLEDTADIIKDEGLLPSLLQTQQNTARQQQQQSRTQSGLGTAQLRNTEQQFPIHSLQQRNQSVITSPPMLSYPTTTSYPQASGFQARSQQSIQTRQSSSQQQTLVSSTVDTAAITLGNWRWIAADGWPDIYSPSYHTSLYEFLLDVWLEAGKNLARGSASAAQAAFKLFQQCQQSEEQLLVQTSLIALCDGLADSEDLQEAAIITLPFQGMGDLLHQLVLPLIGVLYPGELTRSDGCFTPLYDASRRQSIANLDMKTAPATNQLLQSLKTADECLLLLPPDWQTLLHKLMKLQPVHPGVALGPLITLFELDSSDSYTA